MQKQGIEVQGKEGGICSFYIIRKKRQCKFPMVKNSKYCAAHCSDLTMKVECPYEKGMFIDIQKYQKHLTNCPKIRNQIKEQQSGWYTKDVNKFMQDQPNHHIHEKHQLMDDEDQDEKARQNIKEKEDIQCVLTLGSVPASTQNKIIQTIILLYCKHLKSSAEDIRYYLASSDLETLQNKLNLTNDHMQAKLITEKAFQNGLVSPEEIYVEFGAGKGILSFAIAKKIKEKYQQNSKNVLLELQSRRKKFDRFFKDNPFFQRYKGDISNFDFSNLPKVMSKYAIEKCLKQEELKSKMKINESTAEELEKDFQACSLVGVCKHMCGEALDISIRGLLKGKYGGCILASCCHHRCNYNTYLNPKYFESEGLTPNEIQILFRFSSWGTKSHKFEESYFQEPLELLGRLQKIDVKDLQMQQKIVIGRMCKRLIDFGRAEYLKGELFRYCSDQLTPENFVIIGKQG